MLNRSHWTKIKRENLVSTNEVSAEVHEQLLTAPKTKKGPFKYIIVPLFLLSIILGNDLLAINDCGKIKSFLWAPLLIKPSTPVSMQVDFKKLKKDHLSLNLVTDVSIESEKGQEFSINYYIDEEKIASKVIQSHHKDQEIFTFPMGWDKHQLKVEVIGANHSCIRKREFSTVLKQIIGRQLIINDEPFLIKGVIPTFSAAKTYLPIETGLKQIKATGANTLRFYHATNSELKQLISQEQLMLIEQPSRSTWNEVDIDDTSILEKFLSSFNMSDIQKYIRRYLSMTNKNEGFPYLLFNNLGNEWEMNLKQNTILKMMKRMIHKVPRTDAHFPSSYSTYLTYLKYPIDILGVNMLDTGPTYWTKAIELLRDYNLPYYASELGGYLAFSEETPTLLRINRLLSQWDTLTQKGSLGAVIHQSHDNWAQPVPIGYNDPFTDEHPDDHRGFWDADNKPKLEHRFLKKIFSDVSATIVDPFSSKEKSFTVRISNLRNYALHDIELNYLNETIKVGHLAPFQSTNVKLIKTSELTLDLNFSYSTHKGLKGFSFLELPLPITKKVPRVLNYDFVAKETSDSSLTGSLIHSKTLTLALPETWKQFSLNGTSMKKTSPLMEIPITNPFLSVDRFMISRDNKNWLPYYAYRSIGTGSCYLKFSIPPLTNSQNFLILTGLGSSKAKIFVNNKKEVVIKSRTYRENIINLDQLLDNKSISNSIVVEIDRKYIVYISKKATGFRNILVTLEKPIIFSPLDLELKQL